MHLMRLAGGNGLQSLGLDLVGGEGWGGETKEMPDIHEGFL